MDENRAQAYTNLIQQLLSCPNGQEPQILQDNSQLLDAEFLQVCEVIADNLAEEGQENPANFLRDLARQLGQFLGMSQGGDSDYISFLMQLLQTVNDSEGNPEQVYPFLQQNLDKLDLQLVQILTAWAKDTFAQEEVTQAYNIAAFIGNLATLIQQFPFGSRLVNLEIAIASYEIVAIVFNREAFPQDWAQMQNNLGTAYSNRIRGEKAENIDEAIRCYKLALEVYTREDFPKGWAMTKNNLAAAYSDQITGNRAENIDRAIKCYQLALEVRTRSAFPEDWADTQNNLANAYSNKITGNRAENIEKAIKCYLQALEVRTREDFREKWAMTQNNLANAYSDKITGKRAENIDEAIKCYLQALEVYTREAFREKWAMIQNNLGIAYSDKITGNRAENIDSAIAAENIDRAIKCYQLALEVRTRSAFPEDWAMTQNNLGLAYWNKITGNRAENIEKAIKCYQLALEVRTREAFPQNHTETLFNLGHLYRRNHQWQLAYDTYAPAIKTVEFLRGEIQSGDETKQKLAEEWNQLYLGMVEVCIELQRYSEAVEFAEHSKGQNLIELLSVKDLYPKGEIPPEVRQELQNLRLRIAEENQRLKQAEEKNYDIINQLRQKFAEKSPYTPLKFDEIKQLADEKTAIVEWYILSDSCRVFIITNNDSKPQILPFSDLLYLKDLKRLIHWVNKYLEDYDNYRNKVSNEWRDNLQEKLANLAEILHIDEIVNAIPKTCEKLILIPHRYLHLLPLHALPVTNNTAKYLIDAFPGGVSYAPSCQILHQVQKYKRGKFEKLFAIQDPRNNLLAAKIQVQTIKNMFLDPKPEILAEKDAKKGTESEGKLEIAERVANSHHLFFSCHGSFDQNDPLQSGLQLADGTLTLEEIFRHFNLSECSLVTLSACETGQVQLDNTDEYISLTSGFLLAGSPSLYVTLWSVNSLSTAILLIKTYENLYHQPGKLALALNQAQIWVRDTDFQGFLKWTNECHLLDQNQDGRKTLQRALKKELELQKQETHAKIYQNPYHWAGFCMAGKESKNG
jgi:CHAT domain-containing protein/tetratricopeptide (TPR) repeat protein